MWLICGLGNPGKKYLHTRHNIGFDILDSLVKKYSLNLIKKDKLKEIYKGNISNIECILCKPLVFMNQSGIIVKKVSVARAAVTLKFPVTVAPPCKSLFTI